MPASLPKRSSAVLFTVPLVGLLLAGCAGCCGPASEARLVVQAPPACERWLDLRWTVCDGSLVGAAVYYEVEGCLLGRDAEGEATLFVPMFEEPRRAEVEAAIQAGRVCVAPGAVQVPDERYPGVVFMDLGGFVSCDDPRCRGG